MSRKPGWEKWPLASWLAIAGIILLVGACGTCATEPYPRGEYSAIWMHSLGIAGMVLLFVALILVAVEAFRGRRLCRLRLGWRYLGGCERHRAGAR